MKRWPIRPLGDVAEFINGRAFKPSDWSSEGVPIIRIQNLTNPTTPANRFAGSFDKRHAVRDGDLLVSWSATLDVFIWDRGDSVLNQHIFRVAPDYSRVQKRYLFYALKSVMDELRSKTHGATMKHITKGPFESTEIPIPPLEEQKWIVKLLDEADELRKLRTQADRRTTALIPSLFHEMFAEAEERNCPWPKTTLAGLCSRVVDCPHATPTYATSETLYACVRSSDIQEGKLDWSSTKYVDESEYAKRVKVLVPGPDDVVFCREGARLGNAALVTNEKEVCLGQRMMLFRVESKVATPEFLCALLLSPAIQKVIWNLVGGSASPHLNVGDVKEFVTALPPLPLQKEFAGRVSEIRAVQAEQATSRHRLEHLFQSLLHHVFQGEL